MWLKHDVFCFWALIWIDSVIDSFDFNGFAFFLSSANSCDAEPTALAKYVCALVRKDKPESELREICNDQLDVFLQQSKNYFVINQSKLIQYLLTTMISCGGTCHYYEININVLI